MKNNKLTLKLAQGVSLTILVAFMGGGVAQAADALSQSSMSKLNPVQNQSLRQNTKHSNRKAAAKRLKAHHLQEQQQHQQDGAGQHGQGQAGAGVGNNQTPSNQGGAE